MRTPFCAPSFYPPHVTLPYRSPKEAGLLLLLFGKVEVETQIPGGAEMETCALGRGRGQEAV